MKKTIILTGTTSGLGKALFTILAKEKIHILAIDRSTNNLESTPDVKAKIEYLYCDLSKDDLSNFQFEESMFKDSSEVIFIMNAATIQPLSLFSVASVSEFRGAFNTNLFSYLELLQQLVKITSVYKRKLRLVLISTGAINHVINGWASYSASKSAHVIFCRHIAAENGHVSLVEYNPGVFESKMQNQISIFSKENNPNMILDELPNPLDISMRIVNEILK